MDQEISVVGLYAEVPKSVKIKKLSNEFSKNYEGINSLTNFAIFLDFTTAANTSLTTTNTAPGNVFSMSY